MHLKVFVKLKKNPLNPLVWAKKPKKTQKNPKKPKKPTGLVFKKKAGFFLTLLSGKKEKLAREGG